MKSRIIAFATKSKRDHILYISAHAQVDENGILQIKPNEDEDEVIPFDWIVNQFQRRTLFIIDSCRNFKGNILMKYNYVLTVQ